MYSSTTSAWIFLWFLARPHASFAFSRHDGLDLILDVIRRYNDGLFGAWQLEKIKRPVTSPLRSINPI